MVNLRLVPCRYETMQFMTSTWLHHRLSVMIRSNHEVSGLRGRLSNPLGALGCTRIGASETVCVRTEPLCNPERLNDLLRGYPRSHCVKQIVVFRMGWLLPYRSRGRGAPRPPPTGYGRGPYDQRTRLMYDRRPIRTAGQVRTLEARRRCHVHTNHPTLQRLARDTALQREREARRRALLVLAPKTASPWTTALARIRRRLSSVARRTRTRHEPCVHG